MPQLVFLSLCVWVTLTINQNRIYSLQSVYDFNNNNNNSQQTNRIVAFFLFFFCSYKHRASMFIAWLQVTHKLTLSAAACKMRGSVCVWMLFLWLIWIVNVEMQHMMSIFKTKWELLHISIYGRCKTAHRKCKLMRIPAIYFAISLHTKRQQQRKMLVLYIQSKMRNITSLFGFCQCSFFYRASKCKLNWKIKSYYNYRVSLIFILCLVFIHSSQHHKIHNIFKLIPPELK